MVRKVIASLIAKNEKHIWKECIDLLVIFCDRIVIVDTGSTDGSQEFLVDYFKSIGYDKYTLVQDKWIDDFSYSRNIALDVTEREILKEEGLDGKVLTMEQFKRLEKLDWYIFVKDIDDGIENPHALKEEIQLFTDRAYYMVHGHSMNSDHFMRAFVKYHYRDKFRYCRALHETLDDATGTDVATQAFVKSTYYVSNQRGDRSKSKFKYLRDARIMYEMVINNPYSARANYYLAQTLRWQGLKEEAVIYYKARVELNYGMSCERYMSLLRIYYDDKCDSHEKIELLERAIEINEDRFEAPTELMRIYINNNKLKIAIMYGERWIVKPPPSRHFIEVSYVDHSFYLPDLLARAYKKVGNVNKAKEIWNMLLKEDRVLSNEMDRVKKEVA